MAQILNIKGLEFQGCCVLIQGCKKSKQVNEVLNPEILIHRLNSHSHRHLTVTPEWSVNKLAIFNEVENEMEKRDTRQGALFSSGDTILKQRNVQITEQ